LQQQGGADVVFIAGTQDDARRIIPVLDTMGIRAQVLGGDGLSGIQETVTSAEDTYISSAYLPDRPGDRNDRFISAYRTAYRNQLPDHRGAGSYDIVYLLAQAIGVVGGDRRRIRDYLAQVGRELPGFEGVTGTIAFDENGDVPSKNVVVGVVSNRRLITAPGQ
jgi:branched-chain amino acid transport system substrate-binding protein